MYYNIECIVTMATMPRLLATSSDMFVCYMSNTVYCIIKRCIPYVYVCTPTLCRGTHTYSYVGYIYVCIIHYNL